MAGQFYSEELRLSIAKERGIIVDPEDAWLLGTYTWGLDSNGYAWTKLPGKPQTQVYLHHCIIGRPIDGRRVDHIDRNPLNNCRSNLRYVGYRENALNSDRSDSAYHIFMKQNGKYQVRIQRNRIIHSVGTFDTIKEAEEARDQWLSAHGT